jgi:hypothetical protein
MLVYFRVQQDFDKISLWMIQMGFTLALFYLLLLFSKEKFVLSKKNCFTCHSVDGHQNDRCWCGDLFTDSVEIKIIFN